MTTPNGQRRPLETPRSQVVDLFATLTGNGSGNLINADSGINGGGEITSGTHTGTGTYTIVFAKKWSQLVQQPSFSFMDATASNILGFDGYTTAIDVTAGTATFVFAVGSVATDLPATTTVTVRWTVRPVSKN
jgi:hypothetical protein